MRRATAPRVGILLAAAVVVAYLPALDAQFLNWDDDSFVVQNPHVHGLSLAAARWAFSTFHGGNWNPFAWLSHALDCTLFGLDPSGHHAMNLAWHVANTVLVFVALRSLTGAMWPSAAVAALFGLHPLHVESVAWVAERKDVLSTFFFLVGLAVYAPWARTGNLRWYAAVVGAFVLGLLAKPMVLTFPCVLLLLDHWPLRRLGWDALREKLPLLGLAAAGAWITVVAQRSAQAFALAESIALPDRIANALVSYVRYLKLTVWPMGLSPVYSHPALEGPPLTVATIAGAGLLLVAMTVLAIGLARSRPHLLVGWLWYLGTLMPVIGLLQVGGQAMADRYTYVPLIGIFLAVVWEVAALPIWEPARRREAAIAVVGCVLALLGVRTWQQAQVWHDSWTFWRYTLAANPRAAVAYYALGGMYAKEGRVDEAIHAYRRCLKLRPSAVNAHNEAGNLLVQRGRLAAAAAHYRKAIAGRPVAAEDHSNLANVLQRQGNSAAARRHLEIALRLRPDFAEAYNNLGIIFGEEGRMAEAAEHFREAVRLRPDFAIARGNLAAAERALREGEGR